MNRTWPISNFTSEPDPDGIGFVLSRNSGFNESISAQPVSGPGPRNADRCATDPTSDRYAGRPGLVLRALPVDAEGQQWPNPSRQNALGSGQAELQLVA